MKIRTLTPLGTITVTQVLVNDLPLFEHCPCTLERLLVFERWHAIRLTFAVDRQDWSPLIAYTLWGAFEDGSVTTWQFLFDQQPTVSWRAYLCGCTFQGTVTQVLVIVDLNHV